MAASTNSSPVDKLINYGDISEMEATPDYVKEFGFSAEHIPELISMAGDKELNFGDVDSLEVWAPVHAVRALGQLRAKEAIEPLTNLIHELDDDWMSTELSNFFAEIGHNEIPALQKYIGDSSHESYERADAAMSLTQIVEKHPELRNKCVTILTEELENFASNSPDLNACLIGELIDLNAVESAPVIERAFAENQVIPYLVGDWGEVQVSLGLKTREEVPIRRFSPQEIFEYYGYKTKAQKPLGFATNLTTKQKKKNKKSKKHK